MDLREREGFAVARDGSPIYYRVIERQGGPEHASAAPPIILTDGIGCDGYVWKYLIRDLAPRHRLIHWHYRGHGRTPPPQDHARVTIEDLADDLAAVLEAVGAESAVLAGHSMGVQVCLEAFRRHRAKVQALILVCGSHGYPLRTFRGRNTLELALPYLSFAVRQAPQTLQRAWSRLWPTRLALEIARRVEINTDLLNIDDFLPYMAHMARIDLSLFLGMLGQAGRHTAKDVLPTIDVPTLIISGDKDGFTPRDLSEEMHRSIRGSQLLLVPDGSHTAPIERPELVDQSITRFLSELGGRIRSVA